MGHRNWNFSIIKILFNFLSFSKNDLFDLRKNAKHYLNFPLEKKNTVKEQVILVIIVQGIFIKNHLKLTNKFFSICVIFLHANSFLENYIIEK